MQAQASNSIVIAWLACLTLWLGSVSATAQDARAIDTIAFGSCARQDLPMPVWRTIADHEPDLLVLLGDNVYADTDDPARMQACYRKLADDPGFAALRNAMPILGTWDDHDYGRNDGGADWHFRDTAQRLLLDFFRDPADSPRRGRPGVYGAWTFGPPGRRVQVVLLDTRYFRSPLKARRIAGVTHYVADPDPDATVLGDAQWHWLEQTLREPADLRIIGSSIQLLADEHRFEKWANFPAQRQRLLDMLTAPGAGPVVVLSGDRHHMELSIDPPSGLADFTASALNQRRRNVNNEPNRFRVGEASGDPNFGLLHIAWTDAGPAITLEGWSADGRRLLQHALPPSRREANATDGSASHP